jgi:hypothetical protein
MPRLYLFPRWINALLTLRRTGTVPNAYIEDGGDNER